MANDFTILLLEDNADDAFLLERALRKNEIKSLVRVVPDGLEAIDYLGALGKYADRKQHPLPHVLIIDIKMPRMGGLEFLVASQASGISSNSDAGLKLITRSNRSCKGLCARRKFVHGQADSNEGFRKSGQGHP